MLGTELDDKSEMPNYKKQKKKAKENNYDYEKIDMNKKMKKADLNKYENIKYDENFAKNALNKNNYYSELHGEEILELDNYLGMVASIVTKPILLDQSYDSENLLAYNNNEQLGMIEFRS